MQSSDRNPLVNARGRGTDRQPAQRFARWHCEPDLEALEELATADPEALAAPPLATEVLVDDSQSIISRNDSPDIGFDHSLNPYRGCEHGCAYCYARPYHEFLGFDAGLDFESRILAKPKAPELLTQALSSPRWRPAPLACSGVTDCYQPVERRLQLTRRCLEVCESFRQPVGVVTKGALVTRDRDVLASLAHHGAALVVISLTTLDPDLARRLEPRAAAPRARLEAMRELTEAGVPVGVSLAPVIPGLNEHEMPALLEAAADHGARSAFYTVVRLPHGVKDLFADWLDRHEPDRRDRVLGRIREMREGQLNDATFGTRMKGTGPQAEQLAQLFRIAKRRAGITDSIPTLSSDAFRRVQPDQLELF